VKRGIGWPIGVAAVLALTVGVNIWVAVIAGDDPSFSVEQDYYNKAVQWDSTLAQQRVNERLGWRLVPALGAVTRGAATPLNVRLVDSSGAAIGDATVRVSAFYNARAGTVLQVTLTRDTAGYEARLPIAHTGAWELRFDVRRGADRFTAVSRIDAVPSGT
jgi:nitrogen fixation protein FixH